jgi:hypothetical protein
MRPEANNDDWKPRVVDQRAIDEFEAWMPGDPSPSDAPSHIASEFLVEGRRWSGTDRPGAELTDKTDSRQQVEQDTPRASWWTERPTRRYERGDTVRSNSYVGGDVIASVPPGTKGQVVGRELGVLGGEYVNVQFDNGYSARVKPEQLDRRSWWD